MNYSNRNLKKIGAASLAIVFVAACAPSLTRPDGADTAREKLSRLQADSQLASLAPVAIQDAELAVRAAEEPRRDDELGRHLVVVADRKVDTAWALATARLLEDQRKMLGEERERARLDARTREADRARRDADAARTQAEMARQDALSSRQQTEQALVQSETARQQAELARSDAEIARSDAEIARTQAETAAQEREAAKQQADAARMDQQQAQLQAEAARAEAEAARQKADELQRQIAELDAKATERGLVVTLGDVLFETGKSELRGSAAANLGKLASFLNQYQDRSVIIEGHTDSVGSDSSNLALSQRRADSVRTVLVAQGVAASRIVATGKGEGSPVSDNDSSTGRQQNRRVEVIISNDQEG